MKKLILALIAIMTMTAAQAQNDRPQREGRRNFDPTEMAKKRTDDAVKKYGLNEEQAAKLLELNKKYAGQMGRGMRGPRGGARQGGAGGQRNGQRPELTEEQRQQMETMRKEREENQKKYDAELQAILTPEQYEAYQKDAKEREKQGPRREGRKEKK